MAIEVRETKPPVSNSEISAMEDRLEIRLPTQYREWLLKCNGGRPMPNCFRYKHGAGPYTDGSVAWFYAVYDGKYSNFEKNFNAFKVRGRRFPDDLVAIADDSFGNKVCIAFKGPNLGKVYFWDHEAETVPASYRNCHLIADSFDEFIAGLKEFVPPPNWDQLVEAAVRFNDEFQRLRRGEKQ